MTDQTDKLALNFIHDIIDADNRSGKWGGRVRTRFPPEPNGYLHIGHAKSICLNYGLARQYGGTFNLRFDDTNPVTEEHEYVRSIVADVRWLGARWQGMRDDDPDAGVLFASDYFQKMCDWAVLLIRKGKAYVCDLTSEQVSEHRGTLTRPGRDSPYRGRSVDDNLDLFERMRRGEFPDGSKTLRAKIDMAHANLNMRDPIMYRILHAPHHRTGDAWCVYPSYDWAHGLEDSIEGITHSICTLEFENHRPLYNWFIDAINEGNAAPIPHPQQIEFARLELTYTLMSKRRLLELVREGKVRGWDDPRMPTLAGLRRRGYTPEAIRAFSADVGVAKFNSTIDIVRLENALRDQLNKTVPRRMAVLRPLKVVITNWPEQRVGQSSDLSDSVGRGSALSETVGQSSAVSDAVDWLDAVNNPEDPSAGTRQVPFSGVLYIERDDFLEDPPKKFFRLAPGREVRLRYAYFITCREVIKDADGRVVELRCTYDPATRGGDAPDGRKVKATLHWVSAAHAVDAEVRLYDHLFTKEAPDDVPEGGTWKDNLNPGSLEVLTGCKLEPSLADAVCGADAFGTIQPERFQFERLGYFCVDPDTEQARRHGGTKARRAVFNRTVSLKDAWAKIEKRG